MEALEHLVGFDAAPVRAGHLHDLEGIRAEIFGTLDVRPNAEIGKGILRIKGDCWCCLNFVAVFILPLRKTVDYLQLVRLIFEKFAGFGSRDFPHLEGMFAANNLSHPVGNPGQIFVCGVSLDIEIVVKAILIRRAYGRLGCGEALNYGRESVSKSWHTPEGEVTIAIVGKYTGLKDAYKSLNEALTHGGMANRVRVRLEWIES